MLYDAPKETIWRQRAVFEAYVCPQEISAVLALRGDNQRGGNGSRLQEAERLHRHVRQADRHVSQAVASIRRSLEVS